MNKQILTCAGALALLVACTGCPVLVVGAVAGAGAATYAYVNGEVESTLSAGMDKTWSATLAALKDLQFNTGKTSKDALNGHVESTTADGKSITIKLKRVSDTLTEVDIRVGKFGDQRVSDLILDKIKSHLGPTT